MSPDPLQVHSGGADPNLYAYVAGRALKNTDPLGLAEDEGCACSYVAAGEDSGDEDAQAQGGVYGDDAATLNQSRMTEVQVDSIGASPGVAASPSEANKDADAHKQAALEGATAGAEGWVEGKAAWMLLGPGLFPVYALNEAYQFVDGGGLDSVVASGENLANGEFTPSETYLLSAVGTGMLLEGAATGGTLRFTTPKIQPGLRLTNPAQRAAAAQGSGSYPGVDNWRLTTLQEGEVVWGGAPGQGNFYTTTEVVAGSQLNQARLFGELQVAPHPQLGFRPGITAYRLKQTTQQAAAVTRANPQHGAGEALQFFIDEPNRLLEPVVSFPLK